MKHSVTANKEWGHKARKREDAQRGLNNRDRSLAVTEQVATVLEKEYELPYRDTYLDNLYADDYYDWLYGDTFSDGDLYWNSPEFRDAYQT